MQGCLKKASTNTTRSKRRGLLPGNLQTTPGLGHRGSSHCGGRHRELLLLGSNVDCNGRSSKTVKEIKAGEYIIYPRVLRPTTKLLCMYQMERGRLYSGMQDRNTRIRWKYARPIEDGHLPTMSCSMGEESTNSLYQHK